MLTKWDNTVVDAVLRKERSIIGLDRQPYGVDEQGFTGGPVLRGPWGTFGGRQGQWEQYEEQCRRLIAAHIHGHLRGARVACKAIGECIGWASGYCQRCGGTP